MEGGGCILTFLEDCFHLFPCLVHWPVFDDITTAVRARGDGGMVTARIKVNRPMNKIHWRQLMPVVGLRGLKTYGPSTQRRASRENHPDMLRRCDGGYSTIYW